MATIRETVTEALDYIDATKPTYDVEVELLRDIIEILVTATENLDPRTVFDAATKELAEDRERRYSVRVDADTAEADTVEGAKLALVTLAKENGE